MLHGDKPLNFQGRIEVARVRKSLDGGVGSATLIVRHTWQRRRIKKIILATGRSIHAAEPVDDYTLYTFTLLGEQLGPLLAHSDDLIGRAIIVHGIPTSATQHNGVVCLCVRDVVVEVPMPREEAGQATD